MTFIGDTMAKITAASDCQKDFIKKLNPKIDPAVLQRLTRNQAAAMIDSYLAARRKSGAGCNPGKRPSPKPPKDDDSPGGSGGSGGPGMGGGAYGGNGVGGNSAAQPKPGGGAPTAGVKSNSLLLALHFVLRRLVLHGGRLVLHGGSVLVAERRVGQLAIC